MRVRVRVLKAETAAVAAEQPPKVHKLTDLVVEEVSIVDRPANGRQFLIVKSATASEPAAMKISPEEKAKLVRKMAAVNAALAAMNTALDGAEESAGAAVPDALTKTLADIGKLLGSDSSSPTAPATPPVEPPKTDDADVKKAGRKISAANQKKLEAAMTALTELFADVGATKDDAETALEIAATAKSEPAAPPVAPPADAATELALKQLTETVSSLTKAVRTQKSLLDAVRNATPGSRQPNIERADEETGGKDEPEFCWSMDMNAPHTKQNTPVEKSFFD